MDLNLLRVLDALLQDPSTTRAARRVGLSQSAVSAALGRLRAALGDPLFVRQGQRLVPTDRAKELELPLRRLLSDLEALLSGPADFDPQRATDSFKLSGSDFFAELLMPDLAARMGRLAPHMQVQQVDLVPDSHIGILEDATIDLCLIPRSPFPDWIAHEPVLRSRFEVVARQGHERLARAGIASGEAIGMDLFCDLGHVLFSPEGNLRGMTDAALARLGRTRRVVMTLPVFSGVANAVSGSDLIAVMPHQYVDRVKDRLRLDRYAAPFEIPPVDLCMVWHKRSSTNPAHRWLREQVRQVLRALA